MTTKRVGVAIADPDLRGVLSALVSSLDGLDVTTVTEAVELSRFADCEVLVVGEKAGLDHLPGLVDRVDVLVVGTSPQSMVEAVQAGALGYIDADAPLESMIGAIEQVASGHGTIPPELLGTLLRQVVKRHRAERAQLDRLNLLSPREREVFDLVARGLDKEQVAERLFIAAGTVRTHKQSIFKKLDLHSQAELVALAVRCGIDVTEDRDA